MRDLMLKADCDVFGVVFVHVTDLDAFIHAGPESDVCVQINDPDLQQTFICKKYLKNLTVVDDWDEPRD